MKAIFIKPGQAYATDITLTSYGYRLEVYTDDDGASGYGENAYVGYWYSPSGRAACEAVQRIPDIVPLYPVQSDDSPDPFDLACERRHDGICT